MTNDNCILCNEKLSLKESMLEKHITSKYIVIDKFPCCDSCIEKEEKRIKRGEIKRHKNYIKGV